MRGCCGELVPAMCGAYCTAHTDPAVRGRNAFRPARLMKERWLAAAAAATRPGPRLITRLCRVNLCYNASLLYVNGACSVHGMCVRQHSVYDPVCLKWCFRHVHACLVVHLYHFARLSHCLSCARTRKTHGRAHTHVYTERERESRAVLLCGFPVPGDSSLKHTGVEGCAKLARILG